MRKVTMHEFFSAMHADPRDIMPTTDGELETFWRVVNGRNLWGKTIPGWKNPGEPKQYFLAE